LSIVRIFYSCPADAGEPASNYLTAQERDFWNIGANTPVCAFVPQVQVLDNWGWCTGGCSGGGYTVNGDPRRFSSGSYGCYEDTEIGDFRDCGIMRINDPGVGWIDFNGVILVPED